MQEIQETQFRSLDYEDPLEKEVGPHFSILSWKIPWTKESKGLEFTGSQRVRPDWSSTNRVSLIKSSSKSALILLCGQVEGGGQSMKGEASGLCVAMGPRKERPGARKLRAKLEWPLDTQLSHPSHSFDFHKRTDHKDWDSKGMRCLRGLVPTVHR